MPPPCQAVVRVRGSAAVAAAVVKASAAVKATAVVIVHLHHLDVFVLCRGRPRLGTAPLVRGVQGARGVVLHGAAVHCGAPRGDSLRGILTKSPTV